MNTDIILLIIAILCLIIGTVGTVVPVLPGVPLAWGGLLIGRWISFVHTPIWILILTGIAAIVVSILDNIFPITMTKKFGGSKAGTWGCTIGLIVGFFYWTVRNYILSIFRSVYWRIYKRFFKRPKGFKSRFRCIFRFSFRNWRKNVYIINFYLDFYNFSNFLNIQNDL